MTKGVENIGHRDVLWGYASTFFMVGAGVLLFPFILSKMSPETVGIWNIFQTISALVLLLDFGFRPSFARNVSYIFSGVHELQREGVSSSVDERGNVDYSLLRSTIAAMRLFYRYMALAVLLLLATAGTGYFLYIMNKYTGDKVDAIVAWVLLIIINSYNLYTLYYDALLLGKGYVKRNQQFIIVAQIVYLAVAIGFIYAGLGLTAIVAAQLLSTIIRRYLSKRAFFTSQMRRDLESAAASDKRYEGQSAIEVLKAIYPNAVKIGLTYLGGFLVGKSAVFMGSIYLTLEDVAMYGITMQVMDVLARCGSIYYQSYVPKLAQYRAERNLYALRRAYRNNCLLITGTYIVGGLLFVFLGDGALMLIHSKTSFLPTTMLIVAIVISFLEHNHATAAGFIMADNKIPFFIPSLVSGAATIILLILFLHFTNLGLWALVISPGIAQLAYQNWKWPMEVIKELRNAA